MKPELIESVEDLQSKSKIYPTTHVGNDYSVTVGGLIALTDGYPLCVKFDSASTEAITVNPNSLGAKAVVDYFGNPVTNVRQYLIASLRYESISDSFTLLGKGGGGTAVAGDVRKDKTYTSNAGGNLVGTLDLSLLIPGNLRSGVTIDGVIGKSTVVDTADAVLDPQYLLTGYSGYDDGVLKAGTMPNLTGIRTAAGVAQWDNGDLAVYPERGYQKGGSGDGEIKVSVAQLQSVEGELIPANILSGKSIFGIAGNLNLKHASGSITVPSGGTTLTVSGLPFRPTHIMYAGNTAGIWIRDYVNGVNLNFSQSGSGFAYGLWLSEPTITSDGFSGSVDNSDNEAHAFNWWAWGVV